MGCPAGAPRPRARSAASRECGSASPSRRSQRGTPVLRHALETPASRRTRPARRARPAGMTRRGQRRNPPATPSSGRSASRAALRAGSASDRASRGDPAATRAPARERLERRWLRAALRSTRHRLAPFDRVLEPVVAPEDLRAAYEAGRAEDAEALRVLGLGVVPLADFAAFGARKRRVRVLAQTGEKAAKPCDIARRLVLQEPRAVNRPRVLRAPAFERGDDGDAVRHSLRVYRILGDRPERDAAAPGAALQVAPHVLQLHRLANEGAVVLLDHDGAHVERPPAQRHAFARSDFLRAADRQIGVGAADVEEEVEFSLHAHHSCVKASARTTAAIVSAARRVPPSGWPRRSITSFPSPSAASTARRSSAAASASPRCSSIIAAHSTCDTGLALSLPARSGAEPWIGSK